MDSICVYTWDGETAQNTEVINLIKKILRIEVTRKYSPHPVKWLKIL